MAGSSGLVTLEPAHGGFLARAGDTLSVLDAEGGLEYGPVDLLSSLPVAPLESHYVVVSHDEYLTAWTLSPELGAPSAPAAISDDRLASASQLLSAPDGSRVGLFYQEDGRRRFVRLGCADAPPPPPGPRTCPVLTEISPLDDACTDPVCHVFVRLEYLTLALRGWAVAGGASSPVDAEGATLGARAVFDANGEYLSSQTTVSGPEADLFVVLAPPGDFGAFALVGAQSGRVVTAGGVIWAGSGQYWVPTELRRIFTVRSTAHTTG